MSSNGKPPNIALVGGGIVGLTMALALVKEGIPVKLYEQAAHFGEIGAGVFFSPNAVRAMEHCHPGVKTAFDKVSTGNGPGKETVWFDWLNGHKKGKEDHMFEISDFHSGGGCHRAHFLDEMIKLAPEGMTVFHKRLDTVEDKGTDGVILKFEDGSTAIADAVIGCDGIKSRVRQLILGKDNPASKWTYTHKYAYRGLIPMEKAKKALGDDIASVNAMRSGPHGHILTFNVAGGKIMNVVAFKEDPKEWPDEHKLTLPCKKEDAIADFKGWGTNSEAIMALLEDDLDRWGIFDLGHPAPTYCKGRICISGDAAHASSPHHGAGAGVGIEDSAVMAGLIKEVATINSKSGGKNTLSQLLENAFIAFDAARRERTQWLVESSRKVAHIYEWEDSEIGNDPAKMKPEIEKRCRKIWDADIGKYIEDAKVDFRQRVGLTAASL